MKNDPIYVKFIGEVDKTKKLEQDNKWLGTLTGFASTNDLDRHGDIIVSDVLKDGAKSLSENTTVFFNHEHREKPIGKILGSEFRQNGDFSGIHVSVGISKTAGEIWTLIEEEVLNKFSIGMRILDYEFKETDEDVLFYITDAEIVELSVVGLPANPNASIDGFGKMLTKAFEPIKQKRLDEMNDEQKKEFEEKLAQVNSNLEEHQKKTSDMFSRIEELLTEEKAKEQEEPKDFVGSRTAPLTSNVEAKTLAVKDEDDEIKLGLALLGKYLVDRGLERRPATIELLG
jgi:HK97 family phage prohead protease